MKNNIWMSLCLFVLGVASVACAPAYRAPPLSLGEKCANDGLIAGGSQGAQASGVVGSVFAGSGSTHSCTRPQTVEHRCEVEANSRAAVAKQTYKAEHGQVIAYANDVKWKTYNACMARQPRPAAAPPAPAAPPMTSEPAPAPAPAPAPGPVTAAPPAPVPAPSPVPAPAPVPPQPVAAPPVAGPPPPPAPLPPPPPSNIPTGDYASHQGFTGGFGLGVGSISCSGCDSESGTSIDLYLGGFVNPRTAVVFEIGAWLDDPITASIYALSGRYWFSPKFWGKGGIGVARISISDNGFNASESGFGLTGGLGFEVVQSGSFALDLGGQLNILSIEDETFTVLSFLLGLNWK